MDHTIFPGWAPHLRPWPFPQLGHQAANCPNGTINWRQIYGDEAFILRQPIYFTDIHERMKFKEDGMKDLESKAQAYAKASMKGGPRAMRLSVVRCVLKGLPGARVQHHSE